MSVQIGRALREGVERTVSRDGLTFLAFAYVLAVVGRAVVGYVPAVVPLPGGQVTPLEPGAGWPLGDLPIAVTAVTAVVLLLASVAVMAAALRSFAGESGGRLTIGHFTRNYPTMVANLAAGAVLEGVLVGGLWLLAGVAGFAGLLGLSGGGWGVAGFLVAVVVVGLLAAAALVVVEALYFWYVFVVVEGRGFVNAFRGSWRAVEGDRVPLFVLGLLVWVVNTSLTGVTLVPALFLPAPADFLVGQAGSALATVFTLATTARTYVQLVGEDEEEVEEAADAPVAQERESIAGRTAAEPDVETERS